MRATPAMSRPELPEVALHRGEADIEGAGGFALTPASLLGGVDDLLPEVFGVSVHTSMVLQGQRHDNMLRGSALALRPRSRDVSRASA